MGGFRGLIVESEDYFGASLFSALPKFRAKKLTNFLAPSIYLLSDLPKIVAIAAADATTEARAVRMSEE